MMLSLWNQLIFKYNRYYLRRRNLFKGGFEMNELIYLIIVLGLVV